jgi:hypothetical protein
VRCGVAGSDCDEVVGVKECYNNFADSNPIDSII